MLIYYASHSMNDPQTRYQRLKKLVLALFIISRKLKHYFQTFLITVLTEHPLRSIVKNPKTTGKISKWASELRFYGLRYEPRTAIKGQVLADFIADFTSGTTEHADQLQGWILNVVGLQIARGKHRNCPHPDGDPSSNNPLLYASLHPTMKPNTRLS